MLDIRSLTADLTSDPAVLMLNNNELSRVSWKKGPRAGDIIVDMDDRRRLEGPGLGPVMQIGFEREVEETFSHHSATPSISTIGSLGYDV